MDKLIKATVSSNLRSVTRICFLHSFNIIFISKQNIDFGSEESSSESSASDSDHEYMFDGQDPKEVFKDCEEEEELSDDELFEREFTLHKRDYYINKLKYPEMTE